TESGHDQPRTSQVSGTDANAASRSVASSRSRRTEGVTAPGPATSEAVRGPASTRGASPSSERGRSRGGSGPAGGSGLGGGAGAGSRRGHHRGGGLQGLTPRGVFEERLRREPEALGSRARGQEPAKPEAERDHGSARGGQHDPERRHVNVETQGDE